MGTLKALGGMGTGELVIVSAGSETIQYPENSVLVKKKTKGMKRISLLSLIVNGPFTVLFKMLPLIFYFFIVENFRPVHKKKSHEKYKRLINHVSHIVCREKYCIDL